MGPLLGWLALAACVAVPDGAPRDVGLADTADGFQPPPVMADGPQGSIGGVIRDVSGAPMAAIEVALCAEMCLTTHTGVDGSFLVDPLPAVPHAFHLRVTQATGFASPMVPVTIAEGVHRVLDAVVPPMPAGVPLGSEPQEVQPAPGLHVTVAAGAAEVTFGDPITELAALALPPEQWPPIEGVSGTPLAVYYLAPYDADADPPLSFRVDDAWSLAEGAEVRAFVAGYGEQRWVEAGVLEASSSGLEGGWLPMLTTLVLLVD